jgi:hypothetical protein
MKLATCGTATYRIVPRQDSSMESDIEVLQAELKACDYFDSCYQRTSPHDLIETIAFIYRQIRRKELLAVLASKRERT